MNILYTRTTDSHNTIKMHLEKPKRLDKALNLFTTNEPYLSLIDNPEMKSEEEILNLIRKAHGEKVFNNFNFQKFLF